MKRSLLAIDSLKLWQIEYRTGGLAVPDKFGVAAKWQNVHAPREYLLLRATILFEKTVRWLEPDIL